MTIRQILNRLCHLRRADSCFALKKNKPGDDDTMNGLYIANSGVSVVSCSERGTEFSCFALPEPPAR